MNELPITFKLMPIAVLLGIFMILLSIPGLYRAKKCIAREMIAAGIVIIILAAAILVIHLQITMLTTIESVALFIMVTAIPPGIAVLRSLLHSRKQWQKSIE